MAPAKTSRVTAGRAAALKVVTTKKPDTAEDWYPFELGGKTYKARMPKDFVWLNMAAAMKAGTSGQQKADAMLMFMDACLDPSDREAIRARMMAPSSVDPVRGLELLKVIDNLSEVWRPFIEAEFDTASLRAEDV